MALIWLAVAIALVAILLPGGGAPRRVTTGSTAKTGATSTRPSPAPAPSTAPVIAVAPTPGPAALPAPPYPVFGLSVNRLFNDGTYSAAQIDSQLAAVRSEGVRLARSDALWELTEPAAPSGGLHHYDWSFDDRIATALAAHGIEWLALIDYSAVWEASVPGSDHSPPRSANYYANFAGAFAKRYGRGGSFWHEHPELAYLPVTTYEIWNEPDSPLFWMPSPDPARFIDLYLRARDAIKEGDPQARVLTGGVATAPSFLAAALAARPDAAGHIDGVAIHPYAPLPLEVLAAVRAARRALDGLGLGSVPLYVTEFGWTASPPGWNGYAPAAARAGYIGSTASALARVNCDVRGIVLYTLVTPERNPALGEDWFGIRHPDGTPSQSAFAYDGVVAHADRLRGEPPVHLCG